MRDSPLPPFVSDGESTFDSLRALRDEARGGPRVCVAVLDGPVDLDHPCFADADLTRVDTTLDDAPGAGAMSTHGTHVASVIFGRPQTGALGLAADCRGLLLTVFRDRSGYLSQLDLARAIERAVLEGAQVINVSGGERAPLGAADPILERALGLCEESGAVLIAAAGNDGCDCVHVPAALSPAIAVGAMDREGVPVASSNVGEAYQRNGVLAPGEQIPGAAPGGGVVRMTGSSFATPLVSSLAALLLSIQMREGAPADARAIRAAILDSALPCPASAAECERYLAGTLNVPGAHALTRRGGRSIVAEFDEGITSEAGVAH